jgi:hypothetical protein
MPLFRPPLHISFALAILISAPSAWALDVKTGLWEITTEGAGNPQRACYTKELLNGAFSDVKMPAGIECRNEIKESSATRAVTHTVCTGTMNMEGDTRVEVQSPESMTMASTSTLSVAGQKQTMSASARYRWIQADCGDVKPIDPKNVFKR